VTDRRVPLAFAALVVIWGSTWLAIKLGLRDLPPVSFAAYRFVVAALILGAIVKVRGTKRPARSDLGVIAVTGFLAFTVNYAALFWGEQHVSAGLAAVLQATIPAFGLLVAPLHLPGERITARKLTGTLVGIAGVGVVFSDQLHGGGPKALWGSAAIVLGAFACAYSNVLVKAKATQVDPGALALGQMLFGLAPLLVAGLVLDGSPARLNFTARAVACLLYLALVGSAIAFLLFYWMLQRMEVGKAQLLPLWTPLVAVLLDTLVLGERVPAGTAVGGATILVGTAIVVRARR